jgi:hypothetical protein
MIRRGWWSLRRRGKRVGLVEFGTGRWVRVAWGKVREWENRLGTR